MTPRTGIPGVLGILALLLLATVTPARAETRVALVIGNSAYEHTARLANPRNDAVAMASTLRRLGFEVVDGYDLGIEGLRELLAGFGRKASRADVATVFYAGHALQVNGTNYILPVDARLNREQDLNWQAIPLNFILDELAGVRKLKMVLLDACRDNPLASSMARSMGTRSGNVGRGLAVVRDAPGDTLIAYATAGGQTAADGAGRNSPFTQALLAHLEEPDLEIRLLFGKVSDSVTRFTDGRQKPYVYTDLGGTPYYLKGGTPAAASAPSAASTLTPSPTAGLDKEVVFWQSIQSSRDASLYEAYLAQFPDGTFAPLARAKIASLKGEAVASLTASTAPVAPAAAPSSPSYRVSDLRETKWVSARGTVNVRSGPGTGSPVVGRLGGGDEVSVTGRVEGSEWVRVALADGGAGYVYGSLLGDAKPSAPVPVPGNGRNLSAGTVFRDCENALVATSGASVPGGVFCGPELVVIPPGSFMMGSTESASEQPVHKVDIGYRFAVGRYEVTRGEFARFVAETGYDAGKGCWVYRSGKWEEDSGRDWRSPGYSQGDDHPVACIDWKGATSFVSWLSRKTGRTYRLLTESEWEYVARAGTTTERYWGNSEAGCDYANAGDQTLKAADPGWKSSVSNCRDGYGIGTAPVGSFRANGFGLHDLHGNVWEWVEDCWNGSYSGAPTNGRANTTGGCRKRVLRGGSWDYDPVYLRSALRAGFGTVIRYGSLGFRIARTL